MRGHEVSAGNDQPMDSPVLERITQEYKDRGLIIPAVNAAEEREVVEGRTTNGVIVSDGSNQSLTGSF